MAESPRKTVVRFADLDPAVQEFLASMTEGDVRTATELMARYRDARTVGKAFRWVLVTAFAIFMAFAALGDRISALIRSIGR